MPPLVTIPANYATQDSLAKAPGRFGDAHNLRTAVRNINRLNARSIGPFATAVWALDSLMTIYPIWWTPVLPAVVGRVPRWFDEWRLRIYARIEDGETARFQVRTKAITGPADYSTADFEAVGTGAFVSYGTAWTTGCTPDTPAVASVWASSSVATVVTDKGAVATGTIDAVGPNWVEDLTTTGFDVVPVRAYLWTSWDAAGVQPATGPFMVVFGAAVDVQRLYIRPVSAGQVYPVVGQYWQIRRGVSIELASLTIRPVARTSF